METVAKSISQHSPTVMVILIVAVLALIVAVVSLMSRLRALQSRWDTLLREASGSSLEDQLSEHFHERRELARDYATTKQRVDILEEKMQAAKRHLGVIRYDAFDDVGGSQSFALAIYDDRGDGAVLTSLVGRADCRVYGKALTRGRSDRTLSQEEQRAIDEAQRQAPRPTIAP